MVSTKGISGHPMNIGGEWQFDFGKVKMVNAVHSSVLPDGTYGGNPVGFLITNDKESLYFAGDTALTMDMHLIKCFVLRFQVAILPIGSNFTMGISDAVIAAEWIGCDQIIIAITIRLDISRSTINRPKMLFAKRENC